MGNQKQYIEKEQTTQSPKEKVQKDKQRSTKHTYKTKDRVTRTHVEHIKVDIYIFIIVVYLVKYLNLILTDGGCGHFLY